MRSALLRTQLETALGGHASPFTDIGKCARDVAASGVAALDLAIGGIPRGAITEICGAPSSGRTSIAFSILAQASARQEVCAIVDGANSFDPESAAAAGVDLRRLLWVRCGRLEQVLKSADLLLQGGGLGLVILDVGDLPQQKLQDIPPASWFRFQRTIENTPTILLLIESGRLDSAGSSLGLAKSAAGLVLHTRLGNTEWTGGAISHALLMTRTDYQIEIIRSRHAAIRRQPGRSPLFNHVRRHSCS